MPLPEVRRPPSALKSNVRLGKTENGTSTDISHRNRCFSNRRLNIRTGFPAAPRPLALIYGLTTTLRIIVIVLVAWLAAGR